MDSSTALIIAITVTIGCGIIAKVIGHHIVTMVIGVAGFSAIYFYSFWIVENFDLPDFVMMIFFLMVFLFGRIKLHLEGKRGEADSEQISENNQEK